MRPRLPTALALALAAPLATVAQPASMPATLVARDGAVRLNIADRKHAPDAPKEGWCGENAIQQALLYHGVFMPQKLINQAGNPRQPDLYSDDIPVALGHLQMDFEQWQGRRGDVAPFLAWLKAHLAKGVPVLAGMKIHPTKHPEWSLDHFVLVVGYEKDAFLINTTWDRQDKLTAAQLASTSKGLAFANRFNAYYGLAIRGPKWEKPGEPVVRLFVESETKTALRVAIKCEGLEAGRDYLVGRWASLEQKSPDRTVRFRARGPVHAFHDTLPNSRPTIFRCRVAAD